LREYREGCSTVDDFFTEVLRKDLPNFGESKFRRSLSPDFILGALKFIDQKGYHGMTPYDVAARFSEVDEIFTDPVRLHSTVEVALAYETAKLNQSLEEIVNFKFDPIIKPQFECTQLYLSKLGVQDVFQISTRRIDEIVAILSSADRELTDSAN